MMLAASLPWLLLAAVMTWDELAYHRRRGLPAWERWGHPLDTLTVLGCIAWLLTHAPDPATLKVYAALAAFSCIFVTKDEIVHAEHCPPAEHWTHALLFVLHPICLAAAAWAWWEGQAAILLPALAAALTAAGAYQLVYWNLVWKKPRPPSITPSTTP